MTFVDIHREISHSFHEFYSGNSAAFHAQQKSDVAGLCSVIYPEGEALLGTRRGYKNYQVQVNGGHARWNHQ
jgi:uncharacterized protein (DUF39 family)